MSCRWKDEAGGDEIQIHIAGSLLQLRGKEIRPAVCTDDSKNVLVFNGEIYAGLDVTEDDNDTEALFCALREAHHPPSVL